jgi:hypothetical protein
MYSEENIKKMSEKFHWEGAGTGEDPLLITSQGLPQSFGILESKMFIIIEDCIFEKIAFYRCWNISIRKSSIKVLKLENSFKNAFSRCIISKLRLVNSSGNKFEDCEVSKVSNLFSKKNHFENCNLTKKVSKRINTGLFDSINYSKLFYLIIAVFGILSIFWIFYYLYYSIPFGTELVIAVIIFLGSVILFILFKRQKKNSKKSKTKINKLSV